MKALKKHYIVEHNSYSEVFWEMEILRDMSHDFICNIHYAFQDERYLFLVMDVALGGDLRFHLNHAQQRCFDESRTKFYIASLIIALEYVHSLNILHRDIKPENVLMDTEGYLKLTDFGISARLEGPDKPCTRKSGTHGYMAPEIYSRRHEHGVASEAFSLGVVCHEFLCGLRPYDPNSFKNQVACSKTRFDAQEGTFGDGVKVLLQRKKDLTPRVVDFTVNLLRLNKRDRLGREGMQSLREHDWFNGFDWEEMRSRKTPAPFKPDISRANCDTGELDLMDGLGSGDEQLSARSIEDAAQDKFEGYAHNTMLVAEQKHARGSNNAKVAAGK